MSEFDEIVAETFDPAEELRIAALQSAGRDLTDQEMAGVQVGAGYFIWQLEDLVEAWDHFTTPECGGGCESASILFSFLRYNMELMRRVLQDFEVS